MKKTASEIMDVYEKLKCNKMSREEQIKIVYQMLYRGFYYDTKVKSHTLETHLQDVSKIFTRDEMKPHKNLIKKVAKDAVYFMNNQQNYSLLAIDIIKNVIDEDTIRTSGNIFIKSQIEDIIEESFIEDDTIKKKYNIRPVFTRGNYKPSKKAFTACGSIIRTHIKKVIQHIRDMVDNCEYEYDIRELFQEYEPMHHRNVKNQEERDEFIEGVFSYFDMSVSQIARVLEKYCPEIDTTRDTRIRKLVRVFPMLTEPPKEKKPFYMDESETEEEGDIMD
tara:strand:- start:4 stop:837 length:834 start_codon:yes stop_codon:yes gene_type:complete